MGDLDGGVRLDRRYLRQLRHGAGDRHDRPGGRLRPRVSARPEGLLYGVLLLHKKIKGETVLDPELRRSSRSTTRGSASRRADQRDLGALRQLGAPIPVGVNPAVDALRATFGNAIGRALVARDGETIVTVVRDGLLGVMRWLRDTAGHSTTTWWT